MAVGDLQKTVGRNLRAYQLERGLSQEAFADVLGVHRMSSPGFCGGWFIWCRWLSVVVVRGGVECMVFLGRGEFFFP